MAQNSTRSGGTQGSKALSETAVVAGASLGELAGGVLGAVVGFAGATLATGELSGLAVLWPLVYALYGAAAGVLVGAFAGYWLVLKLRGSRAAPASLGLLAGFLVLGALLAVALGGAPPPLDIDPGWFGPWGALVVVLVPGPAALAAHRLGARLGS